MKTSLLTAGLLLAVAGAASAQYAAPANYDLYSGYSAQTPARYAASSGGTMLPVGYGAPAASSSYYYGAPQFASTQNPAPAPAPTPAPATLPPGNGYGNGYGNGNGYDSSLLSGNGYASCAPDRACTKGSYGFGDACGGCGDGCSQWNVGVDALIMGRLAGCSYPFVRCYPAPGDPPGTVTETILDTGCFDYNWEFGYRVNAAYLPACGWGLEFGFFGIADGWSYQNCVTGEYQFHGGGFTAPGDVNDGHDRTYSVCAQTRFYSTQLNAIHGICDWATLRVGLRWLHIEDELSVDGAEVGTAPALLYNARLRNDPVGPQIGADFKLLDLCCSRFRLYATTNVGLLYNRIQFTQQSDWLHKCNDATCNDLAVLGEFGLMAKWRVTDRIALRGGYQILGVNGVGLAGRQMAVNDMTTYYARIDSSTLIAHGATLGFEVFW